MVGVRILAELIDLRFEWKKSTWRVGKSGVRGVAGIGGDVGPKGELGDVVSSGGGCRRELRLGRGGTPSAEGATPNSDIDRVTRGGSVKSFTAFVALNVGTVGEDGESTFPPVVAERRGGWGNEGRTSSSEATNPLSFPGTERDRPDFRGLRER